MNITVKGRGVEITDAMRDYAQKKLNKLSDFNRDLRSTDVTVKNEHTNFKVEVMLNGDGVRLRAEERRPDYYEAVDCVFEKLEIQSKKHSKRQVERSRHHSPRDISAAVAAVAEAAPPDEGNGSMPRITRNKRFAMKPMSAVDAAVEMEMMGHSFYVFRNRSGDVNVVYRRHDGSVGLIEVGE